MHTQPWFRRQSDTVQYDAQVAQAQLEEVRSYAGNLKAELEQTRKRASRHEAEAAALRNSAQHVRLQLLEEELRNAREALASAQAAAAAVTATAHQQPSSTFAGATARTQDEQVRVGAGASRRSGTYFGADAAAAAIGSGAATAATAVLGGGGGGTSGIDLEASMTDLPEALRNPWLSLVKVLGLPPGLPLATQAAEAGRTAAALTEEVTDLRAAVKAQDESLMQLRAAVWGGVEWGEVGWGGVQRPHSLPFCPSHFCPSSFPSSFPSFFPSSSIKVAHVLSLCAAYHPLALTERCLHCTTHVGYILISPDTHIISYMYDMYSLSLPLPPSLSLPLLPLPPSPLPPAVKASGSEAYATELQSQLADLRSRLERSLTAERVADRRAAAIEQERDALRAALSSPTTSAAATARSGDPTPHPPHPGSLSGRILASQQAAAVEQLQLLNEGLQKQVGLPP
ncbi:hypothetical protein Vafri_21808 [Volvox africanus]|uniref:Uncharacterized protein n=1 Tax=Volvox africanus TaxID=51714 RepID=A0A8J4BZJ3_9CHLO|nr:hypothetical protein Vafri_21808 [Volvox africanus]